MKKLTALAGTLLAGATMSAGAGDLEGIYLGPSITGYYLDSERVIDGHDDAAVAGINLGYRFFNDWALEAGVGREIAGDDLDVAKIDFYYWFGDAPDTNWRPYAVAGLSYFDRDDVNNLQPDEEHTHQAGIGLGVSKMFGEQLEFRADARLLHKVREGQDGTNDGALNLALNYYFSKPAPAQPMAAAEPAPEPAPEPQQAPETRTIRVQLDVEFEFDKAVVRAIYGDELQAVANAMKAHDDIDLVLEGHTDSVGSDAYNQDLSERRAQAVKAELVKQYGIDASRISTVGYGESQPIATNSTEEGRAQNRRVIGEMSYTEVVAP